MASKNRRRDTKGRMLKKGETQRPNGTYMYRWTNTRGERKHICAATLAELRQEEQKIQMEILQGIQRDNMTLNGMIERYFRTKASLAASTSENYRYYYEHSIKPDPIGSTKITDLHKSDLLIYFRKMAIEEAYSNGTIHILYKIIHPALQLAVDDDVLRKNPSDGCMKEYTQESEIKYALTPAEETEFLERILLRPRMKRYYPFYAILLYTGLRISEAIGLTWADVDMAKRTITVDHQMQYRRIDGKMVLYCKDTNTGRANTKTKYGKRIIPMTPKVYELFIEQRKEWLKIDKDISFEVDGYKNFVFLSHRTGRNLFATNVRHTLDRLVEMNSERKIQLPHISPHILRHTACTRYAEAGVDIKTIQYLMGHSDIKTTIKVYNHTDVERAKRELEKYDKWQSRCTNFCTNLQ